MPGVREGLRELTLPIDWSDGSKSRRQFYLAFPIGHTLCDQLSWSRYCALSGFKIDTPLGSYNYMVGDTKTLIVGETMQVKNYDRYNWDLFDGEARRKRHEDVFPHELEHAFQLGSEMASNPW